jgi:hypothetical protein
MRKGFRVVAYEANPFPVENLRDRFRPFLADRQRVEELRGGRLRLPPPLPRLSGKERGRRGVVRFSRQDGRRRRARNLAGAGPYFEGGVAPVAPVGLASRAACKVLSRA